MLARFRTHLLSSSEEIIGAGRSIRRYIGNSAYATPESICDDVKKDIGKFTLAEDLASLIEESSPEEKKPRARWELKRLFERRIKKRVKDQFKDGKFHDIISKVVANQYTLRDAYNIIRVNSNVELTLECNDIPFESMAEELSRGEFDVSSNTLSISTRGANKKTLILPNPKLTVVQEAIRIALEVVYKPHYSKTSHGCRSGRGHLSALNYIKEISSPDWWFTLRVDKKLDAHVLDKLISTMESKIEDPSLYAIIRCMFNAHVLNVEFGGFAKGHGLPQEGILSPILINIYLDLLDREVYRMSMRYEALDTGDDVESDETHSKLRGWFRRQINGIAQNSVGKSSKVMIHSCRFMDEVFFSISGSKEVATAFKSEIQTYLKNCLYLDIDTEVDITQCKDQNGVRFLGTLVLRGIRESPATRAVHKLKEKIELLASQRIEAWNEMTVRIGKKWLGHGLKRVKESEIKHLADSSSILGQISHLRKDGMRTDHWYKHLLKMWLQDKNSRMYKSKESILSKNIAEAALPQDLVHSFYKFQKCADDYVASETASTLTLLHDSSSTPKPIFFTSIIAPLNAIRKRLMRYGLTNSDGNPRACHVLLVNDHDEIIDWFSGIASRWLRWYLHCDNLSEVKKLINDQVRQSCILTLATKYQVDESEIQKKFNSELSRLPTTEEIELEIENENCGLQSSIYDEGQMYGIPYSGSCLLSVARIVNLSRPCTCFVMGCIVAAPRVYTIHVMERQRFPGWLTGFSTSIHSSLHKRRIGLCKQHLKDLYLGHISLQSINFGAWK